MRHTNHFVVKRFYAAGQNKSSGLHSTKNFLDGFFFGRQENTHPITPRSARKVFKTQRCEFFAGVLRSFGVYLIPIVFSNLFKNSFEKRPQSAYMRGGMGKADVFFTGGRQFFFKI